MADRFLQVVLFLSLCLCVFGSLGPYHEMSFSDVQTLKSVTAVGVNNTRVITVNENNGTSSVVYLVDTETMTAKGNFSFQAVCAVVATAPLSPSSFVFHCVQTLMTCETDFIYIINYYEANDTFGLTRVAVLPTQYCHSTLVGAKDGNVYLMKVNTTFDITVFSTVTRQIMNYEIPGVTIDNLRSIGQPAIVLDKLAVSVQLIDAQEFTILFDLLQNTPMNQEMFYADAFSPYSLNQFIAWQKSVNGSQVMGKVIELDSFMQDGVISLNGNPFPPMEIATTFSTTDLFVLLSNPTDNQTSFLYEIPFNGANTPVLAGTADVEVAIDLSSSLVSRNSISADSDSLFLAYKNILRKYPYTENPPPNNGPNVAAIVLGVLFGVAGTILIVVAIVYFVRKRQDYQKLG